MLPQKFLDRMQRMLGDEYEAFVSAFGRERYQALRLNALKTGVNAGTVPHLSGVPWAENGYYYDASEQPGKHPYHAAGVYYIQEPSAMAPAELLEVAPGERVLDLCAAPGGKSTQIAAKMGGDILIKYWLMHPAPARGCFARTRRPVRNGARRM